MDDSLDEFRLRLENLYRKVDDLLRDIVILKLELQKINREKKR